VTVSSVEQRQRSAWVEVVVQQIEETPCKQQLWQVRVSLQISSLATHGAGSRGQCLLDAFCRAMRCISAAYVVMRCLSVCLSPSYILSKRITYHQNFSSSGSQAILVFFQHETPWQDSDGNPLNGGVECKGVSKKSRFSTSVSLYLKMMQDRAIVTTEGE